MKRIIFVDDEQQVLDGLRNMLRKYRKEWDMSFAVGGLRALEELALQPVDVIVSDMRMPGMDGAALFRQVKDTYPATARIILSGHADRESAMEALPVAHQYLSKPCDTEVLRATVDRVCKLQALLQADPIRALVGRIERLPSPPRTYWEIHQAALRPDAGLSDLAAIVERDPALTVKVLQLANSSFFGLGARHTSVQKAAAHLGTQLLKALALTAHIIQIENLTAAQGFSIDALQDHSERVASLAMGFFDDRSRSAEAFTVAMVHDVGKPLLALSEPDRYREVASRASAAGVAQHVIEKELFGFTHAEVGAYLLGLWGLPIDLVEAVAYHHRPGEVEPTDYLIAVHVADALSHTIGDASKPPDTAERLDLEAVNRSPLAHELPRWQALAEEKFRNSSGGSKL